MTAFNITIGQLALSIFLITSGSAMAADNSGGSIVIQDKDNDSCALLVPPANSGVTWQYELKGGSTPCGNNIANKISFFDIPSASKILLTDDDTCTKQLSDDNLFWFELKTVKKLTNTAFMEVSDLASYNTNSIVQPGLQLVDKGRYNGNGAIREKLSCVRISVSSPEKLPPFDISISPDEHWSEEQVEDRSDFTCAGDQVIIGRKHFGDENGMTSYRCGSVFPTQNFRLIDREEHKVEDETDSYYLCPPHKVMTGRKHFDDENGPTTYRCASVVDSQGKTVNQIRGEWSAPQNESNSTMECAANEVMVGRGHQSDENGPTRIRCAKLFNTVAQP